MQQILLRFADEYSTRMVTSVDKLQRGTNALDPAEVLKWKIAIATETCFIGSGPNAIANLLDMTKLGFEEESLEKFKRAIANPYGMVLVTGPTGSGKTNTLYSALQ